MLAACMAVRPVLASHPLMLVCRQVQHAGCMTWPTRVRCSCESLVRPYRAGCRGQGSTCTWLLAPWSCVAEWFPNFQAAAFAQTAYIRAVMALGHGVHAHQGPAAAGWHAHPAEGRQCSRCCCGCGCRAQHDRALLHRSATPAANLLSAGLLASSTDQGVLICDAALGPDKPVLLLLLNGCRSIQYGAQTGLCSCCFVHGCTGLKHWPSAPAPAEQLLKSVLSSCVLTAVLGVQALVGTPSAFSSTPEPRRSTACLATGNPQQHSA